MDFKQKSHIKFDFYWLHNWVQKDTCQEAKKTKKTNKQNEKPKMKKEKKQQSSKEFEWDG